MLSRRPIWLLTLLLMLSALLLPSLPRANTTAAVFAQDIAANSLLKNGDFEALPDGTAIPDGWQVGTGNLVTFEAEDGKHFVRLVSQQPEEFVSIAQTVNLPNGVKAMHYLAKYRCKQVHFGKGFTTDGRTLFHFLDGTGQELKPAPHQLIFATNGNLGVQWFTVEQSFLIPEGATQLVVEPCLNHPKTGTLDISELRLTALDAAGADALVKASADADAEKARIAAETTAKAITDEAAVTTLLTQPSVTLPLKVAGNRLVTPDGKEMWLQGVNVPSLEWSAKGEHILQSVKEATVDWKANVVRLPVNDNFWFGRGRNDPGTPTAAPNDPETKDTGTITVAADPAAAQAYRKLIDDAVTVAAARGAYIVLDLHRFGAPDQNSVLFWRDAATHFKNNPAVLFDLFNEPHSITWDVWRNGGAVVTVNKDKTTSNYQSPGMQGLLDMVRSTGANNVVVVGGLANAYDLSGVLHGYALDDKTGNGIVYATHFYNWHRDWQKHFLDLAGKYPILVGECGADIKKMPFVKAADQEDPYTWVPDALGVIQKYHLNWTGFSMHPTATPVMIQGWSYEPTPFWGQFAVDALNGKQFPLGKLR